MINASPRKKRVLVVEDELLISMLIEDTLTDHDYAVVGPFSNLADALEAAKTLDVDIALLDVNLRGEKVYPVADILGARRIPFVLLSGYGEGAIPDDKPNWLACRKPFTPADLTDALTRRLETVSLD